MGWLCGERTDVRYENTYAALRTGVLCVGGKVSVGNILAGSLYSNKVDSAPIPLPIGLSVNAHQKMVEGDIPPSKASMPSSHLLEYGFTRYLALISPANQVMRNSNPPRTVRFKRTTSTTQNNQFKDRSPGFPFFLRLPTRCGL